jgi:hypothetical protein
LLVKPQSFHHVIAHSDIFTTTCQFYQLHSQFYKEVVPEEATLCLILCAKHNQFGGTGQCLLSLMSNLSTRLAAFAGLAGVFAVVALFLHVLVCTLLTKHWQNSLREIFLPQEEKRM